LFPRQKTGLASSGVAGAQRAFSVQLRDEFKNDIKATSSSAVAVRAKITDVASKVSKWFDGVEASPGS
jgi:hypothetical protein